MTKIGISPHDASGLTDHGRKDALYDYVETYLHELVHSAGSAARYTDREIVQAIATLAKNGSISLPKSALDEFNNISTNDAAKNSELFDTTLQHFCRGPEGEHSRPDFYVGK